MRSPHVYSTFKSHAPGYGAIHRLIGIWEKEKDSRVQDSRTLIEIWDRDMRCRKGRGIK